MGNNLATEAILPASWGYNFSDLTQLLAVQSRFGTMKLRKYPKLGFFRRYVWYRYFRRMEIFRILDYVKFDKAEVKKIITQELGWRDYGGKHHESIFTRFFQSYYLPQKFHFDKRRAHLASLIQSGQMTRDQALAELEVPSDTEERRLQDKEFVAKKLGISDEEFDRIMALPIRSYRDYPSLDWLFSLKNRIRRWPTRIRTPSA
jgi:hypothetical protein